MLKHMYMYYYDMKLHFIHVIERDYSIIGVTYGVMDKHLVKEGLVWYRKTIYVRVSLKFIGHQC